MIVFAWLLILTAWFVEFSYLEIEHVNGWVIECSGYDPVSIGCGILALLCSRGNVFTVVAAISVILIGFNVGEALCPDRIDGF